MMAVKFRKLLDVEAHTSPNLIRVAEFVLPEVFDSYAFDVFKRESDQWQPWAISQIQPWGEEKNQLIRLLRVREDVYEAGQRLEPSVRWLLAHEFGHLALGHHRTKKTLERAEIERLCQLEPYRRAEWQANEFAAAFLMPDADCISLAPFEISAKFGVPIRVAENRKRILTKRSITVRDTMQH